MIDLNNSQKNRIDLYSQATQDLVENSLDFKKTGGSVNDIIRYKNFIKDKLLENVDILYALDNETLERKSKTAKDLLKNSFAYWNMNIFPYMRVPDPQPTTGCYILFEVGEQKYAIDDMSRITKIVTFRVVCHEDIMDTDFGVTRLDLISMLISEMFDGLATMGIAFEKQSDTPKTTSNDYYYREIVYRVNSTNNIQARLRNGNMRI